MSAILPKQVRETALSRRLTVEGIPTAYQGKVRNTYDMTEPLKSLGYQLTPEDSFGWLMFEATDRISTHDRVYPFEIEGKGEVLNLLTHFWFTGPLKDFPSHYMPSIRNPELNAVHDLLELYPFIPTERCMVVRKKNVPPYELILRGHIGGSVWKDYLHRGVVAGLPLRKGLKKWQGLGVPLFTPTTKEEGGMHDAPLTIKEYLTRTGDEGLRAWDFGIRAYVVAYEVALLKGLRLLDTKLEGFNILLDEVFTPDSSRYTTDEDYQAAMIEGREPAFYDKQLLRDVAEKIETPWGLGVKSLKPQVREQQEWLEENLSGFFSEGLRQETTWRYRHILERLTGLTPDQYKKDALGM